MLINFRTQTYIEINLAYPTAVPTSGAIRCEFEPGKHFTIMHQGDWAPPPSVITQPCHSSDNENNNIHLKVSLVFIYVRLQSWNIRADLKLTCKFTQTRVNAC